MLTTQVTVSFISASCSLMVPFLSFAAACSLKLHAAFFLKGDAMKVKFTPELCSGGEYSGHIILRMPTYAERLSMYSEEIIDETEGEPGKEPETPEEKRQARRRAATRGKAMMQAVGEKLGSYILEVNIVRAKDGFVFSTFDHLNYDSDMIPVLTECTQRLIGKYEVGTPQ